MPDTSPDPARIAAWQMIGYGEQLVDPNYFWASYPEDPGEVAALKRGLGGERPACSLAELPDWVLYELVGGTVYDTPDAIEYLTGRRKMVEWQMNSDVAEASIAALRAALATPPAGDGGAS